MFTLQPEEANPGGDSAGVRGDWDALAVGGSRVLNTDAARSLGHGLPRLRGGSL